ncbi:cytochrome c oxidase assembly protein subunit 15 [Sphingobacterium allocomposti]|uniref:Cytochrome c oxidase assembly protein subunit 15 n=1 Tax=Sphingobacterium allocomposti TaxID=415956 RepID=A0A5S5DRZ2_9SPHI|nr:COX15/CtaA family protein [Sphingobacterium composti Yoo et al. 2007 non Ten et al. 2007]TYP98535.1 cytochrome c oxidase assembly protein subunit 15 [Sphingobacterium composti Yoo et al. 2007 non Ten et al. 2007]
MYPRAEKRFIKANRLTIIVLFLVIAAGGIVRSTGSGMGCPDWPKCFNRIVPPTDVSQLPAGYEEHYVEGRAKKNMRFAKIVEFFGYRDIADKIRHDESILEHEEFNAAKTWTEYINRLVGVAAGFCLLASAIFSLTYLKTKPAILGWSVLNVFVVVVQAWLGSIVVSTNLMPWIITVHMLLALIIVGISIYTFYLATTLRNKSILINQRFLALKALALFSLLITVVQVVFGTEVREAVDLLNDKEIARSEWISQIGIPYEVHRSLAYVSLGLTILLFFLVKNKFSSLTLQSKYAWFVLGLVGVQMMTGIILARYDVPPVAQTMHLVVASLFFGAQYYLMLLMTKLKR